MQTSLQTLQAESGKKKKIAAIQRTGLYFERGKPNESLGLGSPGQLAGGNEMKQSGRKKKNRMAEWGRHIWAELGK